MVFVLTAASVIKKIKSYDMAPVSSSRTSRLSVSINTRGLDQPTVSISVLVSLAFPYLSS